VTEAASALEAKITRLEGDVHALLAQVGELHVQVTELHELVEQKLSERERVLVGWKEIAAYLGRSVRQARRLADARRQADPLPVRRDGGYVVGYAMQIEVWKARVEVAKRKGHALRRTEDRSH
jgi:hypothetical protein